MSARKPAKAAKSAFRKALFDFPLPYKKGKRKNISIELRDVLAETLEDMDIDNHRGALTPFGVTFDRTKSVHFDYGLFDELLVKIDAGVGGTGIFKPLHQVRIIHWRKTAGDLKRVIRTVAGHYPSIKFGTLMVFKLTDQDGIRLVKKVYRK